MTKPWSCQYCNQPATECVTVSTGKPPAKPAHHGTQADHRKVIIIRTCKQHKGRTQ